MRTCREDGRELFDKRGLHRTNLIRGNPKCTNYPKAVSFARSKFLAIPIQHRQLLR